MSTRCLAIVVALMTACVPRIQAAEAVSEGQMFPKLADFSLEGTLPDTSSARVVVVDFWASWCTPCRAAFPVLDQIQSEFKAKGLYVIAVNVDQKRTAMDAFLKKQPVGFTIVRDANMALIERVAVPTMPTTFVLDARGTVRFIHSGFRGEETREKLRNEITLLLEEKS